ncbi:MAG: class I SAM-dependent methyltransferase [Acidobacteria bacterium]|nr:class I SAM-dependent methyltransferase [Acidobacteriota bacterium]
MDDSGEVDAYSSAAAQAFLDKIDDTFVAHALRLLRGRESGRALDIGTGPGQIVLKLARRLPGWHFTAVDRSPNMIAQARRNAVSVAPGFSPASSSVPDLRVQFLIADGNRLDFPGQSFDFVLCNSVLHHLAEPQNVLSEIARLVKPDGAILLRDLRRPSRLGYRLHVRWYGRHYSGLMYRLYCASVRAAYTVPELEALLRRSPLAAPSANGIATRVFTHARTHLGIERPLA